MSSMVIKMRFKAFIGAAAIGLAPTLLLSAPSAAQTALPEGQTTLVARQPGAMDSVIAKWERLEKNARLGFFDYSGFALAYPDFPKMALIRVRAENALKLEAPSQTDILRYFDAQPPLTNIGRARYAVALAGARRPEAFDVARKAWRGGQMPEAVETVLLGLYASRFNAADHAARMDALLWQSDQNAAARHMIQLAPADRDLAMARLALVGGSMPENAGVEVPRGAFQDAGFLYNLAKHLRIKRRTGEAIVFLANRKHVSAPALNSEALIGEMLRIAKKANARDAVRIASRSDDLFAPGTDISKGAFRLRDRYTDLMWLGGTKALWDLRDPERAIPLFERYGKGARSPLTKAKGFYWAGRAAKQAGKTEEANRLFEEAAKWPEYYYSQLAISELGRKMPEFPALPVPQITPEQRTKFEARPLQQALIAMVKKRRKWQTERAFFQAIGDAAADETEMLLAHQLAVRSGLPEMSVVLGFKAGERGFKGLERIGFPTVDTPRVTDWAITHAVTRQESEFDRTRVSHANARGMMQLLRSTAREQAGMMGLSYNVSWLTARPQYNIQLGDGYYARQLKRYNYAHPLAAGAYNAGGRRISQWLALNGDPRKGDTDWVTWIEKIPANFETRYYIMRVIGNAVTYSHMYPEKAGFPREVDAFLPQG